MSLLDNHGFREPESVVNAKSDYRKASDSAYAFVDENVKQQTETYTKRSDLYRAYTRWCEDSGLMALSSRRFNARVAEILHIESVQERMVGWVWQDIEIDPDQSV